MTAGQLGAAAIFLALWEISVRLGYLNPFIFGQPTKILSFLIFEALPGRTLWVDTGSTMAATGAAFAGGSLLGIAAGLVVAEFKRVGAIASPFITFFNSLPRVALAPLFVVWFGLGISSKVVLGISLVFFILLLNTAAGAKSVDPNLIRICRSLGAGRWTRFIKITVPAAAPSIFAGLKLGLVYALLGVVVGEMIGATHGLGMRIVLYSNLFQMDNMLGILIFLALLTTGLAQLMQCIESFVMRWQD